mgnify:CR=1 FL=1
MEKKTIKFSATKTIQQPTTVRFQTKDGKTVNFKAVETVKVKEQVKFRVKK